MVHPLDENDTNWKLQQERRHEQTTRNFIEINSSLIGVKGKIEDLERESAKTRSDLAQNTLVTQGVKIDTAELVTIKRATISGATHLGKFIQWLIRFLPAVITAALATLIYFRGPH